MCDQEYTSRQRLKQAVAQRSAIAVAAQHLIGSTCYRRARKTILFWAWATLRQNVLHNRSERFRASRDRRMRFDVYAQAARLASRALPRALRRASQLFVIQVLRANARMRRAERAGRSVHFAAQALNEAEKERREGMLRKPLLPKCLSLSELLPLAPSIRSCGATCICYTPSYICRATTRADCICPFAIAGAEAIAGGCP